MSEEEWVLYWSLEFFYGLQTCQIARHVPLGLGKQTPTRGNINPEELDSVLFITIGLCPVQQNWTLSCSWVSFLGFAPSRSGSAGEAVESYSPLPHPPISSFSQSTRLTGKTWEVFSCLLPNSQFPGVGDDLISVMHTFQCVDHHLSDAKLGWVGWYWRPFKNGKEWTAGGLNAPRRAERWAQMHTHRETGMPLSWIGVCFCEFEYSIYFCILVMVV